MSRLEELRKREEVAQEPGGSEAVAAQHDAGKQTARERISALLDAASFVEIDRFVRKGYSTPGFESSSKPGEGVVCGYGTVDGSPVFVFSQDYTVLSGSVSTAHARKILKTISMAASSGVPVVGILDSGGARVAEGAAAIDSYAAILKELNEVSGVIPTICVVAGDCIGTAAYIAASMDFCIAVDKITTIALHGPQIYSSTLGSKIDVKTAFGAKAANEVSGVAQFMAADETACFADVKKLLGYLPANNLEQSTYELSADDINRQISGFEEAYEPKALIANVCDAGDYMEYQAGYGPQIVTAMGRVGGHVVGFVANDQEGTISSAAVRKAARFISIMDAYDIPIITFTNCTGTPVSVDEPTLVRDCAGLISAYAECGTAMLNVVVGEATGDGYAMMCPSSLGADLVFAWPQAVISALPVGAGALVMYEDDIKQAADGIQAKQDALQKYRDEYANPWQAAEQGIVDNVIEPAATRQMLASALEMCQTKRVSRLPKKHAVRAI